MHKKRLLFFSQSANGHYPEYLHHLYIGISKRSNCQAVIVVPASFEGKKKLLDWPECPRIEFDLIPDEQVSWGDGKWYKRNYRFARLVRQYALKHAPDEIIMMDLMICMPYLAFLIPGPIKLSGILYGIYLYRWNELSLLRRGAELFWHWLMAKRSCFNRIFVLNDADSAKHFNHVYHTERFQYLPDPFLPLPVTGEDFREKYGIGDDRKIYFHFGSFGKKKGTLEILNSILLIPEEEQDQYCFVFAGCIQDVIRKDFERLLTEIRKSKVLCLVFNEFCSYEFLGCWCHACDAILLPYLMAYNSSGCIGYAAQFNKPVIGPAYGLLGKLIRQYALGVSLQLISPEKLVQAYHDVVDFSCQGKEYLMHNSVEQFYQVIIQDEAGL